MDTRNKRASAVCRRRLPWLRRFTFPAPDGEIDHRDRKQLVGIYAVAAWDFLVESPAVKSAGRLTTLGIDSRSTLGTNRQTVLGSEIE